MPPKSAKSRHYSLSRQNSVKFCKDFTRDRIFFTQTLFACFYVFTSLLSSLSCNWVILHNEIDQIQVQNQQNPTIIVLYKSLQKGYFTPSNFNPFQCLNKTSNKKGPLKKKCAICLTYATWLTYVPVLGAEPFQFPCKVIF